MEHIFIWLSQSLNSTTGVALCASFGWGVLSIILSPCHLSSIPIVVGYINGQGHITKNLAFLLSFFFSLGILFTIAVIGLITGLMGQVLGDIGNIGKYLIPLLFLFIGLYLLDIIHVSFLDTFNHPKFKRKGIIAASSIGLFFGIAVGPCTFAFMAPILGLTFGLASKNLFYAISLLLFYAIGHCSVIVLAGTFTSMVQKYLNWNERSRGPMILKKLCGILVILGGLYYYFNY